MKVAQDQIAALQAQNQALDARAAQLTNTITDLNAKIIEANTQLAESETNNKRGHRGLQRQVAARGNELERKFTDLNAVREQAREIA